MPVTPLLTRRREVAAKIEATKGTSVHPLVAADAKFLVLNPRMTPEFGTFIREFTRATLSRLGHIIVNKPVRFEFQTEVRRTNIGTATPDEWGKLLQGCAFTETPGASDVDYNPESDLATQKTLSMHLNIDGFRIQLKGCMGNVEFTGQVGQVMLMSFSFLGSFVAADDATLLTITHETGVPGAFQNISFTYNTSTASCIGQLSLNMNNDVQPRTCANDATGIDFYLIGGRDPELSIDPELAKEADEAGNLAFWDQLDAATEVAISWDVKLGATPQVSFAIAKAQIKSISDDDRNTIAVAGLTMGVNRDTDAGDDEVIITAE